MDEVAIYRAQKDGTLWARKASEFDDGRFEEVSTVPDYDNTKPVEPTTYVSHVGMVVALDRVEGALNYVNLALAELDQFRDSEVKLLRQYLINARFLLVGRKAT